MWKYFLNFFLEKAFVGKKFFRENVSCAHFSNGGYYTPSDRFFSSFLSLHADARLNPHLSVRENTLRLMIYVTGERERNKREKRKGGGWMKRGGCSSLVLMSGFSAIWGRNARAAAAEVKWYSRSTTPPLPPLHTRSFFLTKMRNSPTFYPTKALPFLPLLVLDKGKNKIKNELHIGVVDGFGQWLNDMKELNEMLCSKGPCSSKVSRKCL